MSRGQESRRPGWRRPLSHRHIEQLLSNYRHLTPREQRQVEEHLPTCAECRRQLAAFQQMDRLLKQSKWQAPDRRLKDGFYAAIDDERTKRRPLWTGLGSYIGSAAGQAASLVLLTVLVAAVWLSMRQRMVAPASTPGEIIEQPTPVPALSIAPDATPLSLSMILAEPGSAEILTLSKDGHFLAAAQGNQVQIWSTSSGRLLESLDIGAETAVDMAITPNDSNLVVRTSAGRLQRWRIAGGTRLIDGETTPFVAPNRPFAASNDYLAVATVSNQVEFWEMRTGELIKTITDHDEALSYLSFSAAGELLLTGDSSGAVHVWDLNTHTETLLTGPQRPVVALAISPRGDQIAAGFAGGQVRIWSHSDAAETVLQTLPSREPELLDMYFANDGDTFLRFFQDGIVEHWRIGEAQPYKTLSAPALRSGEFAPMSKGLILAGVSADGSVTLWEKTN